MNTQSPPVAPTKTTRPPFGADYTCHNAKLSAFGAHKSKQGKAGRRPKGTRYDPGGLDRSGKRIAEAYRLLAGLKRITNVGRCRTCRSLRPGLESAQLMNGDGVPFIDGVETCGNVWLCPACSRKIRHARAEEIKQGLETHLIGGGGVYSQLVTIPHKTGEALTDVIRDLETCWKKMTSAGQWRKYQRKLFADHVIEEEDFYRSGDRIGVYYTRKRVRSCGFIKAFEQTHGWNGHHPHYHVLWLFPRRLTPEELADFEHFFYERWRAQVVKLGRRPPLRKLCRMKPIVDVKGVSNYTAKAVQEITRLDCKRGEAGKLQRTPFQILKAAMQGDAEALKLWHEYEEAIKGKSAVRWSPRLRKDLGMTEEAKTDEELAAEEREAVAVAEITREELHYLRSARAHGLLLGSLRQIDPGFWPAVLVELFGSVMEDYHVGKKDYRIVHGFLRRCREGYPRPPTEASGIEAPASLSKVKPAAIA